MRLILLICLMILPGFAAAERASSYGIYDNDGGPINEFDIRMRVWERAMEFDIRHPDPLKSRRIYMQQLEGEAKAYIVDEFGGVYEESKLPAIGSASLTPNGRMHMVRGAPVIHLALSGAGGAVGEIGVQPQDMGDLGRKLPEITRGMVTLSMLQYRLPEAIRDVSFLDGITLIEIDPIDADVPLTPESFLDGLERHSFEYDVAEFEHAGKFAMTAVAGAALGVGGGSLEQGGNGGGIEASSLAVAGESAEGD